MNTNDLDQTSIDILLKAAGTHERYLNRLSGRLGAKAVASVTHDLVALYEARDILGNLLIGFPPAVTTPPEILRIQEFFLSDAIGSFADIHQTGPNPWAAAVDESGHLVLSDADRQTFYVVRPGGAGYDAILFTDPMLMIDPGAICDAEPGPNQGLILSEGGFETPAEAFDAILAHAGLDLPPHPAR